MEKDSPEKNMTERLQSLVSREISWFEEEHNKVVLIARSLPILVLGDHPSTDSEENLFTKVIKKLREEQYHLAIPLKAVSRQGNHIHSERAAIRHYPIVIKLDASDHLNGIKAGSGSIGENVLISSDRKCQEKTFLFLKDNETNTKMVYSIEHYCLYFPRTYFCKDENDMIEKAASIAIREAYRLAYLQSHRKTLATEILNSDNV